MVGDPDDDVLEALGRLPDCDERPERDARPAACDERAAGRDRPGPGLARLEDAGQLGDVTRRSAHGRECALPVALVELLIVSGLEQLEAEGSFGRRTGCELPSHLRPVVDANRGVPARRRDLERVDGEHDALACLAVRLPPVERRRLWAGGDRRRHPRVPTAQLRIRREDEAREGGGEGQEDDDRGPAHAARMLAHAR